MCVLTARDNPWDSTRARYSWDCDPSACNQSYSHHCCLVDHTIDHTTLKKLYSRCYKTPLRDHRAESNRHLVSLLVSVLRWRLCPLVCGPPSALSEKKSKQDRLPMPFLYPPSTWHLLPSSPSSPLLSSGLDTHHASDFIGSMVRAPVASQRWLITGIRCFR